MRGLLGVACLALLCAAACGGEGDDDDAAAGSGGADGNGSHTTAGSGGKQAAGSGGTGSGGKQSGGTGGAGSGGSGVDVNSPTARTIACIDYVRGYCEALGRCSASFPADQLTRCVFESAQKCPDVLFSEGSMRTVDGTIDCAQAWRSAMCNDFEAPVVPACSTSGTLASGSKCISNMQCESRICSTAQVACGTCAFRVARGEACDDTHFCQAGDVCVEGMCSVFEPGDAGMPLPSAMQGDTCNPLDPQACDRKYVCQADGDADGQCMPYPRLGDDCRAARACQPGDSYCDTETCVALPAEGQPCGLEKPLDIPRWCAVGTTCDTSGATPVCRGMPKAGESCTDSCRDGLLCQPSKPSDPASRVCIRARFPGDSCTDDHDLCVPGATRCEGGVCVPLGSQGIYESKCNP